MACGTPVITSNTTSLPEVVGDAGIMIDPHDVDLMADKIAKSVITLIGILIGYGILTALKVLKVFDASALGLWGLFVIIGVSLISGIIFLFMSPYFIKRGKRFVHFFETELQKIPALDIILGSVGLIVGLVIAYLLSQPFYKMGPYLRLFRN